MLVQRIKEALRDKKAKLKTAIADFETPSESISDHLIGAFEGFIDNSSKQEKPSPFMQEYRDVSVRLFDTYKPFVDGKMEMGNVVRQIRSTYNRLGELMRKKIESARNEQDLIYWNKMYGWVKNIANVSDNRLMEALRIAEPRLYPLAYAYERAKTNPR